MVTNEFTLHFNNITYIIVSVHNIKNINNNKNRPSAYQIKVIIFGD